MIKEKIKRRRYLHAALLLIIIAIIGLTFYYLLKQETREVVIVKGFVRVAVATIDEEGLEDRVSPTFTNTKTFTILEIESGMVKNVKVVKNPAANLPIGRGPIVAQLLAEEGVKIVIASEFGPGISAMLDEKGIKKILVEPGQKVIDILRKESLLFGMK